MTIQLGARTAAAAAVLALLLSACGGGNDDSSSASAESASASEEPAESASPTASSDISASPSASADAGGSTVEVTETDFAIDLSAETFHPGEYTFVVKNDGDVDHDFEVEGGGIEESTGKLAPGDSESLTVTLEKGSYEIYCPVGDHKGKGMKTEITVS